MKFHPDDLELALGYGELIYLAPLDQPYNFQSIQLHNILN